VKAIKSKAQERKELEHQIRFFLQHGGKVDRVESGVSGHPIGNSFRSSPVSFNQPRESRTLLLNEVKAIDSRKTKPTTNRPHARGQNKPKKILITDDFGEPIRWSWQD